MIDLTYSHPALERTNISRKPEDWVAERKRRGVYVVPVCGSKNLIRAFPDASAVLLEGMKAEQLFDLRSTAVLLGMDGERPVFAINIPADQADAVAAMAGDGAEFTDIRAVGPLLAARHANIMAHARGMMHWHATHGFCGVCGTETVSQRHGHERKCQNEACGVSHFPRTDPAVIMLVSRDDDAAGPGGKCLLGRNPRWPFPMYSTLAGFVEQGETLEYTVYREILEEAGVHTTDITYMASQPWPFPRSLMLGFRARASTFDINIDDDELIDCQWFSRDEVRDMKEFRDAKDDEVRLPRSDSISRWLIQTWLDEG